MRILTWVVVVVALLWGGTWFAGSRLVHRAAQDWFDQQSARGLIAEHGGLSVAGFPNRFDLNVTDLHLADPASGYSWQVPLLQFAAMTWKPWHVLVGFPPEQTLETPYGSVTLATTQTEASIILVPGRNPALDRATLVATNPHLALQGWGGFTADDLRLASRQDAALPNGQEIGLELNGLVADSALLARLPATAKMPTRIEKLRLDVSAALSAPLDVKVEETRPAIDRLVIRQAEINWGDMQLIATGELAPDSNGLAEGQVELKLRNGRQLIESAANLGLISASAASTYAGLLSRLQRSSADGETLTLPLSLSRGQVRFGLIPLGPAPRLR